MSLKSAPYYWVVCDRCGVSAEEYSLCAAWNDPGTADDSAVDAGFDAERGNHLCEDCTPEDREDQP